MPTFKYRCSQGHEWDELRDSTEGAEVSEETCGTCAEGFLAGARGHRIPSSLPPQVRANRREEFISKYPTPDYVTSAWIAMHQNCNTATTLAWGRACERARAEADNAYKESK